MGAQSSKKWLTTRVAHKEWHKFAVKRGDLIEVNRGSYSHWVICESVEEGDDWRTIWCFHVSVNYMGDTTKGVIRYEPLKSILLDSDCETPSKCRINNKRTTAKYWIAKVGALYREPILAKVFQDLHKQKDETVDYDIKTMNCEH